MPESKSSLEQDYQSLLDVLMPLSIDSSIPAELVKQRAKWRVAVRILPPFEQQVEYYLCLTQTYDHGVRASLIVPKRSSIRTQLRELRKRQPRAPVAKLIGNISLVRLDVTDKDLPELVPLAQEFENIRISAAPPDELVLDGTTYDLLAESLYGETLRVSLWGGDPPSPNEAHPLLRWVETLRSALYASMDKGNKPK